MGYLNNLKIYWLNWIWECVKQDTKKQSMWQPITLTIGELARSDVCVFAKTKRLNSK